MERKCPKCGSLIIDDRLIACPKCHSLLSDSEETVPSLSPEQNKKIIRGLHRRFWVSCSAVLGIIALITGFSIVGGINYIKDIVVDRVDKQFKEKNIAKVVEEAAKDKAESLLLKKINPQIENFQKVTNKKVEDFDSFLKAMKESYENDHKALKKEVAKLQLRNHILELGDKAISHADRTALNELLRLEKNPPDANLLDAINCQIGTVKAFWISVTRIKGKTLKDLLQDGTLKEEKEYTTPELIELLLKHKNCLVRVRAAKIINRCYEKGVPEALIKCMEQDLDLEVLKYAKDAFEIITGYKGSDVFNIKPLKNWWKIHSAEINKKLK